MPAHKKYVVVFGDDDDDTVQLTRVNAAFIAHTSNYMLCQPLDLAALRLRNGAPGTAAVVPTRLAKYTPYGDTREMPVLVHPVVQPLPETVCPDADWGATATLDILNLYYRLHCHKLSLCPGQLTPSMLCVWNGAVWLHPRAWDTLCYDPDGVFTVHTIREVLRAALRFNSLPADHDIQSEYMIYLPWPVAPDLYTLLKRLLVIMGI